MIEEIKLFAEVCLNSLPVGSIYCLLALSYVLIFKGTKVLNLSQGEIMMLGAYICYSFMEVGLSFLNALLLSLVLTCVAAFLSRKVRPEKDNDRPGFRLRDGDPRNRRILAGPRRRHVGCRPEEDDHPVLRSGRELSGISMNYGKLSIILIAVLFIVVLEVFFKVSKRGMAMKATASNRAAAGFMGVNVTHVSSLSWVLAAVISVFPGVFLAKLLILRARPYRSMDSSLFPL